MRSEAIELLRSCDLPPLFINVLGWERNVQILPVTVVEIGVANPKTLSFRLTGVAQKRGVQVHFCPPDEYGSIPSQTVRRLIQAQIKRSAYHNLVIYSDAARRVQVWQWAEKQVDKQGLRVYEHRLETKAQKAKMLVRLTAITFDIGEEARLTMMDVVRRLQTAFTADHTHIKRGRWHNGLRAYDLAEMDAGLRFWWECALRGPRLTGKAEYPLACAMRNGDGQALDVMLRAHLHLVAHLAWRLAKKHGCSIDDYLDLVQTANLEMIRLASGFDPDGGVRFQTFLTPRILKTLERVLAGEEGMVPIPRYLLDMMPKIDERRVTVADKLAQRLGRAAFEFEVSEQLAAEYQATSENVARVLFIRDGFLSWDALVAEWESAENGDEDSVDDELRVRSSYSPTTDSYQSISEAAVNLVRREQLAAVLNNLTPRERDVVQLRFGLDDGDVHTLEEVGQRFGVTRERVRQIELRALKKLRRMGPVDVRA